MPDLINFTLPELNGEVTDKEMKQIKNYLFQLTEQMKFYLNNIDTDNFTEEYKFKLSQMIDSESTNSKNIESTKNLVEKYKNALKEEINASAELITGNKGGYVVINDSDSDGLPDEILIMDTSDKATALKMWIWNKSGLMFKNKATGNIAEVAIDMNGRINANFIGTGILKGIRCEIAEGTIGGWNIEDDCLYSDYGNYRTYIQSLFSEDAWAFSVQERKSGDLYVGKWLVTAKGDMTCTGTAEFRGECTFSNQIMNNRGQQVISPSNDDGSMRFGAGAYNSGTPSVFQGGNVHLRFKNGGKILVQRDTTTYFNLGIVGWKFGDEESFTDRPTFSSTSSLVIDSNGGKNGMFLVGLQIHLRGNTYISGNADISGNVNISGTTHFANDVYLSFAAASGTVALAVDKNGKITVPSSSQRYKENITENISSELNPERLYNCPVVQYNYKPEFEDKELVSGTQIGIIAEDLDKYYPNACIYNKDGQPESWQDRIMIPAMLKLIQNQKKEIDDLKNRLSAIENKLAILCKE